MGAGRDLKHRLTGPEGLLGQGWRKSCSAGIWVFGLLRHPCSHGQAVRRTEKDQPRGRNPGSWACGRNMVKGRLGWGGCVQTGSEKRLDGEYDSEQSLYFRSFLMNKTELG